MKITPQYLKECFSYDGATGLFTWLERPITHFNNEGHQKKFNAQHKGKLAGRMQSKGYITIRTSRDVAFLAHRMAWAIQYGQWPSEQIDHINGDRLDNRIANLREATHAENCRNIGITKKTSHGVVGVTWCQEIGKWQARINCNRQRFHLGSFALFDDAVAARRAAEIKYHGEFGAMNRNNTLAV